MKTSSIIRVLDSIYGKKKSFSEDELHSIDTLLLSRLGFDNKVLTVDFNDLTNFNNLSCLTIDSCMLDKSSIDIISSLKTLKKISFYNCEIVEDIYESFNKIKVNVLRLSNFEFDISRLTGSYEKLILEGINLKKYSCTVNSLDIFNCEINDVDELLECNFEELIISSSQYLVNQLKFDDCGRKIVVMEDNGQFISKKVGF